MQTTVPIQKLMKKWGEDGFTIKYGKELLNSISFYPNGAWKMKIVVIKYIPAKNGNLSEFISKKNFSWYYSNVKYISEGNYFLIMVGK